MSACPLHHKPLPAAPKYASNMIPFLSQELVINPLHQELEPFNWVLAWQDVMPLGQVRIAWAKHSEVCVQSMSLEGVEGWVLPWHGFGPKRHTLPIVHVLLTRIQFPCSLSCRWRRCSSPISSPSGTPCCGTGWPTAPTTTRSRDGEP